MHLTLVTCVNVKKELSSGLLPGGGYELSKGSLQHSEPTALVHHYSSQSELSHRIEDLYYEEIMKRQREIVQNQGVG